MLEKFPHHLHEIITEAQILLLAHFKKDIDFSKIIQLSEDDRRNLILRLVINNPTTNMPQTIILKKTAMDIEGETEEENMSRFARDWAGIEFLTKIGGHYAPNFYAGSLQHKFILIQDLGEDHPSLVGPLTRAPSSSNRQEAVNALKIYIQCLGKMHADTTGKSPLFHSILHRIYSKTERVHFFPETHTSYILKQFKILINVESKELQAEIQAIHDFANSPNDFYVYLHGDICPDNVYYKNSRMHLIDFEYGDFGNALIDGVYLRMCMPSCWCAKAVPLAIYDEMEKIYRNELKNSIQSAADDTFYNKQLVYACAYWIMRCIKTIDEFNLIHHEWIGQSGPLDADSVWDPQKNASRPRILSRLEAFISVATTTGFLPCFRDASIKLLSHLRKSWPETSNIELFPVFG